MRNADPFWRQRLQKHLSLKQKLGFGVHVRIPGSVFQVPRNFFKAEPETGTIQPGDRVNVQISFTPPDARPYRIKLPFKVTNNNMRTRSCLLKGVGVDLNVQFDPPMVEMGPVLPHADPISREIVMTNTSEAPLEIYSTDFDAAYLEEEEVLRQCERFGFEYADEKLFLSADTPEGRPRPPGVRTAPS